LRQEPVAVERRPLDGEEFRVDRGHRQVSAGGSRGVKRRPACRLVGLGAEGCVGQVDHDFTSAISPS
jgi:hypothetical protein